MLKLIAVVILNVAAVSLLFYYSKKSLLCDTLMCDLIVEVLSWYDNLCLMRIDSTDNLTNDIHVDTSAQAYTWDIANESLSWDISWLNWLQRQDVRLPVVGWHDRRGQHSWVSNDARSWKWVAGANVLGRMCLLCTILLIDIGWHERRDQHNWVAKWCKAMKVGWWANVLGRMCLYAPF